MTSPAPVVINGIPMATSASPQKVQERSASPSTLITPMTYAPTIQRPTAVSSAPTRKASSRRGLLLIRGDSCYQRTSALPQVNPLPKAASASKSPRFSRPDREHSSSAIGTVAAVVFPYFWMLL